MGILSFLMDIYENSRKTTSAVKDNKPKQRNYTFDSGLTGSKKEDRQLTQTPPINTQKSKKREEPEDLDR